MAFRTFPSLLQPLIVLQLRLAISRAQNLTLTFTSASSYTCANPTNASSVGGITFTTSSTPCAAQCINLADIFTGESSGIVQNDMGVTCANEEPYNITYAISNQAAFDSAADYNRIFYQQTLAAQPFSADQEIVEDQAWRSVNFYSDEDCKQGIDKSGEVGERVEPYYVQDCVSPQEGQCNTAVVAVRSFLIANVVDPYQDPPDWKCREFAYNGVSDGVRVGVWAFGVFAGCAMAVLEAVF